MEGKKIYEARLASGIFLNVINDRVFCIKTCHFEERSDEKSYDRATGVQSDFSRWSK